jgi:hypothetical protein
MSEEKNNKFNIDEQQLQHFQHRDSTLKPCTRNIMTYVPNTDIEPIASVINNSKSSNSAKDDYEGEL